MSPSSQPPVQRCHLRSHAKCPPIVWVSILCAVAWPVSAAVQLARPFSDGMVLQCDARDPVWGTADPGEKITIRFAGRATTTTADASGRWQADLEPVRATAEPRTLTVEGTNTVSVRNVLIGEVWFCSGQSNMEVGLERLFSSKYPSQEVQAAALERINHELAAPTPGIRLFRTGTQANDAQKNLWTDCDTEALRNHNGHQGFSAVAYFFGQKLAHELRVPIGLIEASVGGTTIETWTPPRGKNFVPLVAPILPFGVRGVIWYQGESNLIQGDDAAAYAGKVKLLIESWRELWHQSELPFYYVELPPMPYSKRRDKVRHTPQALPVIREGQAAALALPHTGRIVTTDLAPANDLHPYNKWDVGQRLAALALAQVYGHPGNLSRYPTFESMKVDRGRAVLSFTDTGGGLKSADGESLRDFEVAGGDRKFVPAEAVVDGNQVIVSSPAVPAPVAVRFAWHEAARPNLCTAAGLPAAPFRTDMWPVETIAPTPPGDTGARAVR